MTFSALNLPVPTMQQSNPLAGVMQSFQQGMMFPQDLQKAILSNQILQAQAQYAQPMEAANLQQAQALPKLTLAEAAHNNSMANLNQEQAAQIAFYLRNPAFLSPEGYSLAYAMSKQGINPAQIPSPQNINAPSDSMGLSGSIPQTSSNMPSNASMQPQMNQQQMSQQLPAAFSKYFVSPSQQAAMTAEATENVQNYNAEQKTSFADTMSILKMIKDLDQFHQNYQKSNMVGPKLGELSSSGWAAAFGNWSPEQQADRSSSQFVTDAGHELGGRMTNMILSQIKSSKIDRTLNPQAEVNTYNYLRSNLVRALQANDFVTAARHQGLPWEDTLTSWNQYNQDNPAFNSSNQEPQPVGNFQSYVNPQISNILAQGQRINPKAKNTLLTPPSYTVKISRKGGKLSR